MPRDPFRAMRWQLIGFYLTGSLLFMGTLAASAIYYYSTAVTMIASTLPETKKDRQAPLEAKKPPTKSVPTPPESQATKPKDNSEKILPKKSVPPVPETITVEPREMVPKIVPDKVGPPAPDPKQVKPKDVPKEIVPQEKTELPPPKIVEKKPDNPPVPKPPIDRKDDVLRIVQNPKFPGVRILKAEEVNRRLTVKAQVLNSQREALKSALKPLADEATIDSEKVDYKNVVNDLLRDAKLGQLLPDNIVWDEAVRTFRIADAVDDATCEKLIALLEANVELLSEAVDKKPIVVQHRPKDLTATVQKALEKSDLPGVQIIKATQKDRTLSINVVALQSQLPAIKAAVSSLGLTVELDRSKSPTVEQIVKNILNRGNIVKSVEAATWDPKSGKLDVKGVVNNSKERVEAFKKLKSCKKILEEAVGAKDDQMEIDVTNLEEPGEEP